MDDRIDVLFEILHSEVEGSEQAAASLAALEQIANGGSLEVAEGIAEIFAFSPIHHDSAKAYFWYHVALASRGYLTSFENHHDTLD